jgi:uncharacterized protein YozE (UPF0346 family)
MGGGTTTFGSSYPYSYSNTIRRQLTHKAQPWCSSQQNIANKQYNTYHFPTTSRSYGSIGTSSYIEKMESTKILPSNDQYLGMW